MRPGQCSTFPGRQCFNPRICKRCDIRPNPGFHNRCCFNPRICKRCDKPIKEFTPEDWGFNPRICKRCDQRNIPQLRVFVVSIHASVKDATYVFFGVGRFQRVSIHASVKDATFSNTTSSSENWSFNPRICKRCDPWHGPSRDSI